MSGALLKQVPHFDGVHRLPWTTVPRGFTRVEWITRLGPLIEQADEPKAGWLRQWRADLEAIEDRPANNKRSGRRRGDVCVETFWSSSKENAMAEPVIDETTVAAGGPLRRPVWTSL